MMQDVGLARNLEGEAHGIRAVTTDDQRIGPQLVHATEQHGVRRPSGTPPGTPLARTRATIARGPTPPTARIRSRRDPRRGTRTVGSTRGRRGTTRCARPAEGPPRRI